VSGSRNGLLGENGRYSKEDMLSIYTSQKELGLLGMNLSRIFSGSWDLDASENVSSNKDSGPEICWYPEPRSEPLGMRDMDEPERQVWSSRVLAVLN
jgi:PERQ amino acid-rich with GYF domain-containing protein